MEEDLMEQKLFQIWLSSDYFDFAALWKLEHKSPIDPEQTETSAFFPSIDHTSTQQEILVFDPLKQGLKSRISQGRNEYPTFSGFRQIDPLNKIVFSFIHY